MRIATWNVNSLRVREDMVLDWLESEEPDVLCMQETKITDQEFPEDGFGDLDYDVTYHGQTNYNGVAFASRIEATNLQRGFPEDGPDTDRRLIAATFDDLTILNVYVPNGQSVGSDKYAFKLNWLERLREYLDTACDAEQPVIVCGDFNICPGDLDHFWKPSPEPRLFATDEERRAFQALLDWGLTDAFRLLHPDERAYTWWDYRGRDFMRDEGLRIDHLLVTNPVRDRLEAVTIDRRMRAEEGPSDHVPVIVDLRDT